MYVSDLQSILYPFDLISLQGSGVQFVVGRYSPALASGDVRRDGGARRKRNSVLLACFTCVALA